MTASITCPKCGATSYNPHDIAERYCGRCNRFQDEEGALLPPRPAPWLPDKVTREGDALWMRSDDWVSIRLLAKQIDALSDRGRTLVMAGIMSVRLMNVLGFYGRILSWAIRRYRRRLHFNDFEAWTLGFTKTPKFRDQMIAATIGHMFKGKDREDYGSVGGFSARELQFIANLVDIARD